MTPVVSDLFLVRLHRVGVDLNEARAEEDAILERWLRDELQANPDRAIEEVDLAAAVKRGRKIYHAFNDAFSEAFLVEDGPGIRYIRRLVKRRFGTANGNVEEAALARILERREKLLDDIRRKGQPSLLAEDSFDETKLLGYMRNVARIESLKLPKIDLPWSRSSFAGPFQSQDWAEHVSDEPALDFHELATAVSGFWCSANGFTREHRLEGLVSLGLGPLANDPGVKQRCQSWLADRLPAWEERRKRLHERAVALLSRYDQLRDDLLAMPEMALALREKLEQVEALQISCRLALANLPARLRPRPAEVAVILGGTVKRKVGALRHDRIRLEEKLLRRRVVTGCVGLEIPWELKNAVDSHLGQQPPSPRQQGLPADERAFRRAQSKAWLIRANELLLLVRAARPTARSPGMARWLEDVEDLYEFGILGRKGVLAAPGRRHGQRLAQIFRAGVVASIGG